MEHMVQQQAAAKSLRKREEGFGGNRRPDAFFRPANIQPRLAIGPVDDPYEREADAMAGAVMRMTSTPFIQRKCAACEKEDKKVQRKESGAGSDAGISYAVDQTLRSGGQQLDKSTRSFMESRFGYDFSQVQIHNNPLAHRSSSEINALAYTHGNHIVFGVGKYRPETEGGKQLLAHELTHVVQQGSSIHLKRSIQRLECEKPGAAPPRSPQESKNPIDKRAQAVIDLAANKGKNEDKAVAVVTDVICNYYPDDAAIVDSIIFDPELKSGLRTTSKGKKEKSTGVIKVSEEFLTDTNQKYVARRILQVGHEIEHIHQYRSGLGGENNKDEREFLAFYDEALADEFEGTGRMSKGSRTNLIDGAIGYYYCLSDDQKKQYKSNLEKLQTRRKELVDTGRVKDPGEAPTSCTRQ